MEGLFFHSDARRRWRGKVAAVLGDSGTHFLVFVFTEKGEKTDWFRIISVHQMHDWTFYQTRPQLNRNDATVWRGGGKESLADLEEFLWGWAADEADRDHFGEEMYKAWNKWRQERNEAGQQAA